MTKSDQRMKFTLEEEEYTVVFQSNGVTTDEILEHFIMFMKGCGYNEDSVYVALQESLDERKALSKAAELYDKDACKDLV
jgi:hypothetical protein